MEKAHKITLIRKNQYTINSYPIPQNRQLKRYGGLLNTLQKHLKNKGDLYYFLLKVFAPVLLSSSFNKTIGKLLNEHGEEHVILNVGSGPTYYHKRKDIINIDIHKYDEVDIVADIVDLPIEDNMADLIINIAILEHVDNVEKSVDEMLRVLKPGGKIFCFVPFMQPFHSAPQDFHRWTMLGIEKLFSNYEILKVDIAAGPSSGMLWVVQEWLAILFSFGSKLLHDAILMVLMVLTMPVKLLDIILVKFPNAEKIASGFYIVATKR